MHLSELLLGVYPRSDFIMCVCIDACLYVYLSELLLGDSPRSGMCAPERAVAWSLSTLRHVVLCTYCMQVFVCFFALPE